MSQAGSSFARMRPSMTVVAGILSATVWSATAFGADKVTFLTSWFAQAEHGGFYQAKATGLYEKAGLDVTLKMGGPQVNGAQLLLAGETDFMMGYDLQVLKMLEQGLPVITVGTSFQFDLQGIMAHDNVASLGDLKDKTILVATPGRTTWWPWLKGKFKYTDEQTRPYTREGNLLIAHLGIVGLDERISRRGIGQIALPSFERRLHEARGRLRILVDEAAGRDHGRAVGRIAVPREQEELDGHPLLLGLERFRRGI